MICKWHGFVNSCKSCEELPSPSISLNLSSFSLSKFRLLQNKKLLLSWPPIPIAIQFSFSIDQFLNNYRLHDWSPSRVRGWTFLLLNAATSPPNFLNLKKESSPLWLHSQRWGPHRCELWDVWPPSKPPSWVQRVANQSSFDRCHFSSRANFSHAAQHYWHVLPISTSSFLDLYFSFVYF